MRWAQRHEIHSYEANLEPYSFLALEYADRFREKHHRWPAKRFRVEVPMGDGFLRTHLLTLKAAVAHVKKHGGGIRIVEVIPPPLR